MIGSIHSHGILDVKRRNIKLIKISNFIKMLKYLKFKTRKKNIQNPLGEYICYS